MNSVSLGANQGLLVYKEMNGKTSVGRPEPKTAEETEPGKRYLNNNKSIQIQHLQCLALDTL